MKNLFSVGIGILMLIGLTVPSMAQMSEELSSKVPESKDFKVIYKADPTQFNSKGYAVDNSERYVGTLKRIAYYLKTVDKSGKESWVYVSMDPFTQDLDAVGVPLQGLPIFQMYVNNMEIFSNVEGLKTGKFEKGNIEFWACNYHGGNSAKIPGATGKFDFGDAPGKNGGYGSMQVHNYLEKQTVFSFSNINSGKNSDLGIGNNPKGHPDWTFSHNAKNLKSAELIVAGKFENLKEVEVVPVKTDLITMRGETKKAFYAENEPMEFVFTLDFGNQPLPKKPYLLKWTRTGDDGKRETGKAEIVPGKPVIVKTSTAAPGFVRIQAFLTNSKGITIRKKNKRNGRMETIAFDGGAGVSPEKLKSAVEEPADFDSFWARQKEKLAKVPVKYTMTKVSKPGAKVEVYAVSVDCAGPRPVTGYLTIPAGAKEKSLPATVSYHGYGTGIQRAPKGGPMNRIHFNVNAHGYDLGKDAAYYKDFFSKIKSNGKGYAFDPKQNSDPETAYFNGMALRVMRSLQFVKQLPQWNGKRLAAAGGSQGGLQTIWAAALDPDVTDAYSSITWCCDFAGPTIKRLGGWRPAYVPALNYYDSVFHAKRIKCNIEITRAGLGDYVCPPSGLAILYNNLKAPKKIVWFQGSTHGFVPKNPQKFVVEEKKK